MTRVLVVTCIVTAAAYTALAWVVLARVTGRHLDDLGRES